MKKYLLPFVAVLYVIAGHAQSFRGQAVIDSLVKELNSGRYDKLDSNRFHLLTDLSFECSSTNPGEGIKYASQALELSRKHLDKEDVAIALHQLGNNYEQKSAFATALQYQLQALEIFERANATIKILIVRTAIANIYGELKNYRKSLEYDSVSLIMNSKLGRKRSIAVNLANMGCSYEKLGNTVRALECLKKALEIDEELGDMDAICEDLLNLGNCHGKQKNYALELSYTFRGMKIAESLGDNVNLQISTQNIGNSYMDIAKETPRKTPADTLVATTREENLKLAIKFLSRSVAIAREIGDMAGISAASERLAEALDLAGDHRGAYEAECVFAAYRDSVYSADNRLQIANIETKREQDLKEKQIELNAIETKNKNSERILYAAILAVGAAGVYKNFRTQRKTNRIQAEALAHKEMLMKEIHHRVKNNLQVISTLLDLQLVNITDEQAKGAITESTTRLKAISLMHQQLYQDDHITTIEFSKFAGDLHTQLSGIFGKPGQRISLQNDIPAGVLDIDTAVPLGMILNELMTNSYKYAFNGSAGTILLKTEKYGEDYRLTYSDNGPGLPAAFDIKTSKSLGMRIIYRLSRQLGGSFVYDKQQNVFIITFKDAIGRKNID